MNYSMSHMVNPSIVGFDDKGLRQLTLDKRAVQGEPDVIFVVLVGAPGEVSQTSVTRWAHATHPPKL